MAMVLPIILPAFEYTTPPGAAFIVSSDLLFLKCYQLIDFSCTFAQ